MIRIKPVYNFTSTALALLICLTSATWAATIDDQVLKYSVSYGSKKVGNTSTLKLTGK